MPSSHKELAIKLRELEGRIQDHDEQIVAISEAIRKLTVPPVTHRKKIGFEAKEPKTAYGRSRRGTVK